LKLSFYISAVARKLHTLTVDFFAVLASLATPLAGENETGDAAASRAPLAVPAAVPMGVVVLVDDAAIGVCTAQVTERSALSELSKLHEFATSAEMLSDVVTLCPRALAGTPSCARATGMSTQSCRIPNDAMAVSS